MESKEELQVILERIKKWEKDQKDLAIWDKIMRLPFQLIDKITPAVIHEKIGTILNELSTYIDHGGRYLISEKGILSKFGPYHSPTPQTLQEVSVLPITTMEKVVGELTKSRANIATVQGATTGFGGVFTLAIDIPASLAISLKILQEIALTYGYNPQDRMERIFIIKCFHFASSNIVGKRAILEEMELFLDSKETKQAASQIQGWREVFLTYKDNFGTKKLLQMIPIAGMVFGAYINRKLIEDVADAGHMLYKKRRVLERLNQPEPAKQDWLKKSDSITPT